MKIKLTMRKLVVLICVFLIITGILLTYFKWLPLLEEEKLVSILHIWLGFFFIVIFPMYAWDHIRTHRQRLKSLSFVSVSGGSQFLAGIGLIVSGIILLLYGMDSLTIPAELHEILTYVLMATLILHSRATR